MYFVRVSVWSCLKLYCSHGIGIIVTKKLFQNCKTFKYVENKLAWPRLQKFELAPSESGCSHFAAGHNA